MNDADKAHLIDIISLVPTMIVILTVVWMSLPVPFLFTVLLIIGFVGFVIPYTIPRYKHYRKALAEFEEAYRYVEAS